MAGPWMRETPQLKLPTDFQQRYNKYLQMTESSLDQLLPPAGAWPVELHEAIRYSVFSAGKRLRPVLVLATCHMLGRDPNIALRPACAAELIHAYSLVHDDLPCMDDDEFRRGRPTTHVVYGEAMAVLVGDALQARAFEVLSDPAWPVPAETARRVIWELAVACGSVGLVAGQVADLAAETSKSPADVERIHKHKTGALFRACVRMGALTAGVDDTALDRLTMFAEHFGLAFQIVDDILDVTGDEKVTGRPAGSDERAGKWTFVKLFGVDGARRQAQIAVEQAISSLDIFGQEAQFLKDLATFVLIRER